MAEWPNFCKLGALVEKRRFRSGNELFIVLKREIVDYAELEEIDAIAEHAALVFEFLVGVCKEKKSCWKQTQHMFQVLATIPSWVAAFEQHTRLHRQIAELPRPIYDILVTGVFEESIEASQKRRIQLRRKMRWVCQIPALFKVSCSKPEKIEVAVGQSGCLNKVKLARLRYILENEDCAGNAFAEFDANGSGRLSFHEIKAFLQGTGVAFQSEWDSDGNGELSIDEFLKCGGMRDAILRSITTFCSPCLSSVLV